MKSIYDSFGFLFLKANEQLLDGMLPFLEAHQLTPKQMGMLMIIASHPGITQKEAGTQQQTDRTSVMHSVDDFERRGLVERRKSTADRRANGLYLTSEGDRLAQQIFAELDKVQQSYFAPLSQQQVAELHRMMMEIVGRKTE